MKTKKILVTALFIAFSFGSFFSLHAETTPSSPAKKTAVISGKVLDLSSGEALAGVKVTVEGTDINVFTDLDGNFSISNMEPGTYNLISSLISYSSSLVEKIEIEPADKEELIIKLSNE